MTVTYEITPTTPREGLQPFRSVGTTSPTAPVRPNRFFALVLAAGCAAGTLTVVTPDDAAAMRTVVARHGTLPGPQDSSTRPSPTAGPRTVPTLLEWLKGISGLSWGELGRATGVSRRTIHNWLGGARVAEVHLVRLWDVSRVVHALSAGSAEATRAVLLQPVASGRSALDDLELAALPVRRRPISHVSVGDLLTPVDESPEMRPERAMRQSSLRGGALARSRPGQS